jgi:hypothetical protein
VYVDLWRRHHGPTICTTLLRPRLWCYDCLAGSCALNLVGSVLLVWQTAVLEPLTLVHPFPPSVLCVSVCIFCACSTTRRPLQALTMQTSALHSLWT